MTLILYFTFEEKTSLNVVVEHAKLNPTYLFGELTVKREQFSIFYDNHKIICEN